MEFFFLTAVHIRQVYIPIITLGFKSSQPHTFMNLSSQSMSEDASKFSERKKIWIFCEDLRLVETRRRKYFRIRLASDCRFIWQSGLQSDSENCNKTSTLTSKLRFVAENGCFLSLLHLSRIVFGSKDFSLKMFFLVKLLSYLWNVFFFCWFCVPTSLALQAAQYVIGIFHLL